MLANLKINDRVIFCGYNRKEVGIVTGFETEDYWLKSGLIVIVEYKNWPYRFHFAPHELTVV